MPPGSASVSDSSVPPCQLIAIIAALGISHCSAPLRLLDSLLGFPTSSWSLDLSYMFGSLFDARCPCSHSAYSQLPGALVVTRPTASCCAQSWLLGALLVYRRLPVCSILSPLGALNFNRGHSSPSWLLCRALLGNMQQAHSSSLGPSWLFSGILVAGFLLGPSAPLWLLDAVRGYSMYLLLTGQCLSSHSPPSGYSMPTCCSPGQEGAERWERYRAAGRTPST